LALGLLTATALVAAAAGLRAPHESSLLSIDNTLTRDAAGCAGVRSTVWHPLSGIDYTGRLRITLPPQYGGAITMFVGDNLPLDLEASTDKGEPVALNHERFVSGPGVQMPPDFWLDDGSPLDAPRQISRITIDALGERDRAVTLSLGRRAPRVLARLVNYAADVSVAVCATPVPAGATYFASGWYGEERDADEGTIRWMRKHGAVLVGSDDGRTARVRVRVAPRVSPGADREALLHVRVNDVYDAAPRRLADGFADYEWTVPDTAWVPGTNELLFTVSETQVHGTRTLGLALASLHVQ
jgi:hypothetical protein